MRFHPSDPVAPVRADSSRRAMRRAWRTYRAQTVRSRATFAAHLRAAWAKVNRTNLRATVALCVDGSRLQRTAAPVTFGRVRQSSRPVRHLFGTFRLA